jgi:hypothetical protein
MQPNEITFFSVALFLALAILLTWKHRRDAMHARLTKGLRGYVANRGLRPAVEEEESAGEELITA